MKVALWALAGFVLGAALVVLVAGVIVPAVWTVSQAEGAYAMGVIFGWMPIGGILGGVIGSILAVARRV